MSLPEYHRRFTDVDGLYEIWAGDERIGWVRRFRPIPTRSERWQFSPLASMGVWESGKYGIGFKTIGAAVEALFATKRGADGKPPERNDDEPRPNVPVARRAVRQRNNNPKRRNPKASTQGVGRKNRRGAGR